MSNDKNCQICGRKATCLKRSATIFVLYIQTGRMNELTESVRENLDCSADCSHWIAGGVRCSDS